MDRRMSLALGLTVALVATTGCASGRLSGAPTAPPPTARTVQVALADTTADAAEAVTAGSGTSQAAEEVVGQLEFHAFDLGFDPTNVTVDGPGRYAVTFVNDGSILHDMTFDDGTVLSAEAGETVTGEVVVPAEGLGFICSVPGHKDAGMTGTISVAGESPRRPLRVRRPTTTVAPLRRPASSPTRTRLHRSPTTPTLLRGSRARSMTSSWS